MEAEDGQRLRDEREQKNEAEFEITSGLLSLWSQVAPFLKFAINDVVYNVNKADD